MYVVPIDDAGTDRLAGDDELAAVAAAAFADGMARYLAALPDGWVRAVGAAAALVSGAAAPTLNGVWVRSADVDRESVDDLLDRVAATGLPHCLQVRPAAAERLAGVAAARGMTLEERIPLMLSEDAAATGVARDADGLRIRELQADEAHVHAGLLADGFELPVELFVKLVTPSVLAAPGIRCYVGEIDGRAVTTGAGVTLGDHVGVFNIATPPQHRRRGYGAAVTARAVTDGVAAGARSAYLQSSAAGYRVYERLGFRKLEDWRCWTVPS